MSVSSGIQFWMHRSDVNVKTVICAINEFANDKSFIIIPPRDCNLDQNSHLKSTIFADEKERRITLDSFYIIPRGFKKFNFAFPIRDTMLLTLNEDAGLLTVIDSRNKQESPLIFIREG